MAKLTTSLNAMQSSIQELTSKIDDLQRHVARPAEVNEPARREDEVMEIDQSLTNEERSRLD